MNSKWMQRLNTARVWIFGAGVMAVLALFLIER
jgi:hypothetical protein